MVSSPYLRLFADSAVDWLEYDDSLLKRAREERKPLHISIGSLFSTHTPLEKRFYEREVVGKTLNEAFINVKIDANERPDLERVFTANANPEMRRLQTGRVELYPTTLFVEPKMLTHSMPQCLFVFDPYDDFNIRWRVTANDILQAHLVASAIEAGSGAMLMSDMHRKGFLEIEDTPLTSYDALMDAAYAWREEQLEQDLTTHHRSYVQKVASQLIRLWYFSSSPRTREDTKGLDVALIALTQWVRGLTFDHVEGGFYAPMYTNGKESSADLTKTLALNGCALALLMSAVAISRDSLLTEAARETANFIVNRLQLPEGGFAASQYEPTNSTQLAWDRRTVRRALTEDEHLVVETLYGLDKKANWHGRWLLRRTGSWNSVVNQLFFSKAEAETLLESGRAKLRSLAASRDVSYATDARIFTSSNALTISALLFAGHTLGESRWTDAAVAALRRVHDERRTSDDSTSPAETLPDLALLLRATLDALKVQWDDHWVAIAKQLVESIKTSYWRDERLMFNRNDLSGWLLTLPNLPDLGRVSTVDATRRGLQLYATLFQDSTVFHMLQRLFKQAEGVVREIEIQHYEEAEFLLDFHHGETVVVLTGPKEACSTWQSALTETYHPLQHVYYVPFAAMRHGPAYLPRMMSVEDRHRVTAYVMHDGQAYEPLHDLEATAALLAERATSSVSV